MCNLPSLMARTLVQSITVGILWATVITVQSENSVLMVFCKIKSVALSIDAVASSSTSIRLLLKRERPKQNNCRCPMLQFAPASTTGWQFYHKPFVNQTRLDYCGVVSTKLKSVPEESNPSSFSSTTSLNWHFLRTFTSKQHLVHFSHAKKR